MAAIDDFASYAVPPAGGCRNAAAVAPSDSTDLTNVTRFLIAAVAGNIALVTQAGQSVTIAAAAGIPIPLAVARVKATGTSATGITALW
jgi:hypothetical protein